MDIVKVSIMGICGMMLGFILKETSMPVLLSILDTNSEFMI